MRHAVHRPPSAAHRWLSCPGSVKIMPYYPNEPTEASIKGDTAHKLLEDALVWGIVPDHPDVDIMYSVMMALEYIMSTYKGYGDKAQMWSEQELDIPETGEFGNTDTVMVTDKCIHVIDYKNGYVPVDIKMNPQLMLYLLGAIARWGERKHYKLTVIQPNFVHSDGMIRHFEPTEEDIEWFRREVAYAMMSDEIKAGKHCKTSYCPHRGTCEVFNAWIPENLKLAWFPGEVGGMSDEQLSEALEQAEILQGYRDSLRGEAIRRILHQDRTIAGYKIVKAKKDRDFANPEAQEGVYRRLTDLGATEDELSTKQPISVAGVERVVKRIFKSQGRGAWMKGMDHVCPPEALAPTNQSLTLEKSIDGRKPYKRGTEFGPLKEATPVDDTSNTSNTSLEDIL